MTRTVRVKSAFINAAIFVTFAIGAVGTISMAHASQAADTQPAIHSTVLDVTAKDSSVVKSGLFSGRSRHFTRGEAKIIETDTGYKLVLSEDFYLDGAPTPVLGFGNDGEYDAASQFAKLENIRGGQSYDLPKGFNPNTYSQVYVWCEDFSIPLGVADVT